MINDQQQIYVRAANIYVSQGVNLYTIHGTCIFYSKMNDVEVKWLNERWKTRNDIAIVHLSTDRI